MITGRRTPDAESPDGPQARLVTVCPAGLHSGVRPDLHLGAVELLAARQA
ncbi:hypothetical protein ACIRBX_27635 [Kitasatospora sp. NPDC096147]